MADGVFFFYCMLDVGRGRFTLISMTNRNAIIAVLLIGLMSDAGHAYAQELNELRPLSFGIFGVQDNNAVAALTVTPDNDTFADPQFVMQQDGQRGEYTLTGLPPNVSFFLGVDVPNPPSEGGVTLTGQTPATRGGGPEFRLDGLTISNGGVLQSDGAGDATLYIGGSLYTSGTGERYDGGTYNGTYNITIYY